MNIFEKIKKCKNRIIIVSSFFLVIMLSLFTFYIVNFSLSNKQSVPPSNNTTQPIGYEKLEEIGILFDDNKNLIYPNIVDNENPTGEYQYMPVELENYDIQAALNSNENLKNEIELKILDNKEILMEKFKFDTSVEIEITEAIYTLMQNIVPNTSISLGESIDFERISDLLYLAASSNAKTQMLSVADMSNLFSLVNLNFKKEFNRINLEISGLNSDISLYGGGGAKPPPVNPTPVPVPPVVDTDFGNNDESLTELDQNNLTNDSLSKLLQQDINTRLGFAITYTALVPCLIALSILAVFTFNWISVSLLVLDIISVGAMVYFSWSEYSKACELKELINDNWNDTSIWLFRSWCSYIAVMDVPYIFSALSSMIKIFVSLLKISKQFAHSCISIFVGAIKFTLASLKLLIMKCLYDQVNEVLKSV